jgi:hypothetical protein
MEVFPPMDKQLDGWLSWTWAVRVERMPSAPYEQVARDVEGAVFDGLVRASWTEAILATTRFECPVPRSAPIGWT